MNKFLINRINTKLPQTQCQKCGFRDCFTYAQALVGNSDVTSSCPPGGEKVKESLQEIVGRTLDPLRPHLDKMVVVEEDGCIGCTKCIDVCPMDSIVGAKGMIHEVIERWCTGCGLCVPVCPTDCITFTDVKVKEGRISAKECEKRYDSKNVRREKKNNQKRQKEKYINVEGVSRENIEANLSTILDSFTE